MWCSDQVRCSYKKCVACKEAVALDETPMQVQFEENLEAVSFTAQINRGGLFAPQEHVLYLGQMCWRVYFELKETPALKLKMLQANRQSLSSVA